MREPATDPYGWIKRVGTLISIPLILGLSPVVGCASGWALDRVFGTRPGLTIIGLLAGFVAGVRETWFLIRRTSGNGPR